MNYILLLMNIMFLVAGQILFKVGLQHIGGVNLATAWKAFLSPYIVVGLLIYAAATGVWFVVLSRMSLSVAYPLQSVAYVLGVLAAWQIFGESVPTIRWVGVLVVFIGIILIAYEK